MSLPPQYSNNTGQQKDEGAGGSSVPMVLTSHPTGIEPEGNYLLKGGPNIRSQGILPYPLSLQSNDHPAVLLCTGLGAMQVLSDELLLGILAHVDAQALARLALASRSLYCFCNHEDVWRALVLQVSIHHAPGPGVMTSPAGAAASSRTRAAHPTRFPLHPTPYTLCPHLFKQWCAGTRACTLLIPGSPPSACRCDTHTHHPSLTPGPPTRTIHP